MRSVRKTPLSALLRIYSRTRGKDHYVYVKPGITKTIYQKQILNYESPEFMRCVLRIILIRCSLNFI